MAGLQFLPLYTAVSARLVAVLTPLKIMSVEPLESEADLERAGKETGAFILIRGGRFGDRPGAGGQLKGDGDVMVYLRSTSAAHVLNTASTKPAGGYQLLDAVSENLNGFAPLSARPDNRLVLAEAGIFSMKRPGEITFALRFQYPLAVSFAALLP